MPAPQSIDAPVIDIATVTILVARPEAADDVERALAQLSTSVRTEGGQPRYRTQRAVDEPEVFVTTELWSPQESVETHVAHGYLQTLLAQSAHLLAGPPQTLYLRTCDASRPHADTAAPFARSGGSSGR